MEDGAEEEEEEEPEVEEPPTKVWIGFEASESLSLACQSAGKRALRTNTCIL